MGKAVYALCALALVAACRAEDQTNKSAASDRLIASAETRVAAARPLNREQALALMERRHDNMETLGDETKRISNQLKSGSPDVLAIQQSSGRIFRLAPDLHSWFPRGTGPDVGDTRAKPEIWQKPQDFGMKAHRFVQAAEAFNSAANGGDLGQISASFATLGKACKACHDLYRAPEHD